MLLTLDGHALAFADALRGPVYDVLFGGITWLGSLWLLIPLTLICAVVLLSRGYRSESAMLILSLGGAALLTNLCKWIFARRRPDLYWPVVDMPVSSSFPSAHTAQATAFFLGLFVVIRRIAPDWAMLTAVISVAAVLTVALSRIYLQVHFPSDVLGGLVLGALWVLLSDRVVGKSVGPGGPG
jgi:undecaprenyl-diphosphatase